MKHRDSRQSPDSGFSKGNRERFAWLASLLLVGMLTNASAQPAPITPKVDTSNKNKDAVSLKAEVSPATETPSRYVSGTELDGYLESVASVFTIKKRLADPFGQVQDPDAKPKPKPIGPNGPHQITKIQATPFADIIRLIKVTTIMPMEKRFLIGNQSYRQGQHFPVTFRSKNINVEVVTVSSRQITFRNIESGETASIDLNLLPKGMTSGAGNITAPGMVRDVPNAPLLLDGGDMPFDNSHNR